MDRTELGATVRQVCGAVLGRDVAPEEDLRRDREPKWDSLKHIELMFALEERFEVSFSEEELAELNSLSGITDKIALMLHEAQPQR